MKNMLLMRYRALIASMFEYVRTRGNTYGKLFSFANSRVSPTENGGGTAITELCQIANGIPESVDDTMLYCLSEMFEQALACTQYPEDLLMQFLTKTNTIASAHSNDILFGRGDFLWGSNEIGQPHIQYVEDLILRSLTKTITNASGHSDNLLFGLGNYLNDSDDRGLGKVQYVEDLILQSLTKSITRGSGHTYNILFGQSIESIEMDDRGLGRVAGTERAIANSITKLLHIAGLSPNVGFTRGVDSTEEDNLGLGRIAIAESTIAKDITRLLRIAGPTTDVGFGRGLDSTEEDVIGLVRSAIVEHGTGRDITKLLHEAGWSADNIGFGKGLNSSKMFGELRLDLAEIIRASGTDIYKLLKAIASPSDSNLLNGRGSMSVKLAGNSSISLKDPEETRMIYVETLDNNVVGGTCQELDPVLFKTDMKTVSMAGGFLMDTSDRYSERVKTSGTSLNYMTAVAGGKISELLEYFTCTIDDTAETITLHSILYDKIYEDTGTYNVTIPDKIGGYSVIIDNES